MQISRIKIKNFRGLSDIEAEFKQRIAVVVGPNAVGKSSILQAIRLTKAVLAPSYQTEAHETLKNMGILSTQLGQLDYSCIAGNSTKPVKIRLTFCLTKSEIALLKENIPKIARLSIFLPRETRASDSDLDLTQLLSSNEGKRQLLKKSEEIFETVDKLTSETEVNLGLTISPNDGVVGDDAIHQVIIVFLCRLNGGVFGRISFFPADRSLPAGEPNLQLGAAHANHLRLSHISRPELKYQHLKQILANIALTSPSALNEAKKNFDRIFTKLIPGKSFQGLRSNNNKISVLIHEKARSVTYDIDHMSSGEKGLLLTFFLAKSVVSESGIILLDEPELHLNPAICRKVLPFLIEEIATPHDLQVVLCTHSSEILGQAYEREDCNLLHLRNSSDLSPILCGDRSEAMEALSRLGVDTADVLFSQGSLFVEGVEDEEVLEIGFSERVSGLRIRALGGREEVLRSIRDLQSAENDGNLHDVQTFIFDRDRKPSTLESTSMVKVVQWERYCFENYLLDNNAIYDIQADIRVKTNRSRGEIKNLLRSVSFEQLNEIVASEIYRDLEPENCGFRPSEIRGLSNFGDIAKQLAERITKVKNDVELFSPDEWVEEFERMCTTRKTSLSSEWEETWETEVNGKLALKTVHQRLETSVSFRDFRRKLISAMCQKKTENWRLVDHFMASSIS